MRGFAFVNFKKIQDAKKDKNKVDLVMNDRKLQVYFIVSQWPHIRISERNYSLLDSSDRKCFADSADPEPSKSL